VREQEMTLVVRVLLFDAWTSFERKCFKVFNGNTPLFSSAAVTFRDYKEHICCQRLKRLRTPQLCLVPNIEVAKITNGIDLLSAII
jgi:hypothetical protein